jgi:hypothetical protein
LLVAVVAPPFAEHAPSPVASSRLITSAQKKCPGGQRQGVFQEKIFGYTSCIIANIKKYGEANS